MALDQLAQNQQIPAERGEIRDANGVLLATSVELQSVFATPPSIQDPGLAAALLAQVLDLPAAELRTRLESKQPWVWLKRRVSLKTAETVRALDLRGVGMLPETQRVYPVSGVGDGTTIAAQVIGYVNVDGHGQYGVEGAEDAMLAGSPGSVTRAGGRGRPPDRRLCLPAQRSGQRLRPEADDRRRGPAPAREADARDLHPEPRGGRHRAW